MFNLKKILGGLVHEFGPDFAQIALKEVSDRIARGQSPHKDIPVGTHGELLPFQAAASRDAGQPITVFLDGADVTGICKAANDVKCYADVYLMDKEGKHIFTEDGTALATQRIYGRVEIRKAAPPVDVLDSPQAAPTDPSAPKPPEAAKPEGETK